MKKLFSVIFCISLLSPIFYDVKAKDLKNISEESTNTSFEFELFKKMPQDENFMFSPLSIKLAFMLAANGSENKTQTEILNAFNITDLDENNDNIKKIVTSLTKSGAVSIANSVWINTDFLRGEVKFNNKYLQKIEEYLNSEAYKVNSENAVNTINEWVKNKTHDKIKHIVYDSNFLAMLINAIYFKADWEKGFKIQDTKKDIFTDKDGEEKSVDFMQQEGTFNFFDGSELELLEMKYKNTNLSMYIILPRYSEDEITYESLQKAMKYKKISYVDVKIPKFKTKTTIELTNIMKSLGISKAFKKNCVDFNNVMFENISKYSNVNISEVIQKTFIEVDEKGTEAAAVTKIGMRLGCIYKPSTKHFYVNRPFKYLIKDNEKDEILFMGSQVSI